MTTRRYTSTSLRIAEERCPAALDRHDRGEPIDTSWAPVGSAAHYTLEAIQMTATGLGGPIDEDQARAVADRTIAAMVAGRITHRGRPQPPIRPDEARAGADLALAWHRQHGTIHADVVATELGLAMDRELAIKPYRSDGLMYSTQIDLTWIETHEDEEGGAWCVVTARDYKTSWAASEDDLDSSQMRMSAVLALAWARSKGYDPSVGRVEIANVRKRQVYSRDLTPDEVATIAEEMRAIMVGLDEQPTPRPAVPSWRCGTCPYLTRCGDGTRFLDSTGLRPRDMAERLVAHKAAAKATEAMLRQVIDEDPIDIGTHLVGPVPSRKATLDATAPRAMTEAWRPDVGWSDDAVAGLVSVMRPGPKSAKRLASELFPGRTRLAKADRDAWLAAIIRETIAPKWGIARKGEADSDDDGEDDET